MTKCGHPPRQYLSIIGSHTEADKKGNPEMCTDFNFYIDLTRALLRLNNNGDEWSYIAVVADGDGQKAFQGSRCRSQT